MTKFISSQCSISLPTKNIRQGVADKQRWPWRHRTANDTTRKKHGGWCDLVTYFRYMYIHVNQIIKNQGPGLYNSLRHADNRQLFSGL